MTAQSSLPMRHASCVVAMPLHVAGIADGFPFVGGRYRIARVSAAWMDAGAACADSDAMYREGEGEVCGDRRFGSVQPGGPGEHLRQRIPERVRMVSRVSGQGDENSEILKRTVGRNSMLGGRSKV